MNDEWKEWVGGRCPVLALDTVECVNRAGRTVEALASSLDWSWSGDSADILRYRLLGGSVEPLPEGVVPPRIIAWRASAGPGHAVYLDLKVHADLCSKYEGWQVRPLVYLADALQFAQHGCVCRDTLLANLARDFPDSGAPISAEVFADWLSQQVGDKEHG